MAYIVTRSCPSSPSRTVISLREVEVPDRATLSLIILMHINAARLIMIAIKPRLDVLWQN